MKTILVPVHEAEAAEAALQTGYLLADRFGSYLEGLYVRRVEAIVAGEGFVIPQETLGYLTDQSQRASEEAERFRRFVAARDVPLREVAFQSDGPIAGWRDAEGHEGQIIGERGRLFDLIVLGRLQENNAIDTMAAFEAALFESGRPALVAPARPPERIGENIVIVWNCSTETARAVGLAMPLLQAAQSVTVLTVEGGTVPGPSGQQLANHLTRAGINVSARNAGLAGRSVGHTILAEAQAIGADLLIKGAYTSSRLRQLIFGGPTQHLVTSAQLPVLFAH